VSEAMYQKAQEQSAAAGDGSGANGSSNCDGARLQGGSIR